MGTPRCPSPPPGIHPLQHNSVHSRSSPNPCPTRLRTHFSHKSIALHSPFCVACGSRGKPVTANPPHNPVFQFPSIPQLRFRKLTHHSTLSLRTTSPEFPLFLPELRVLLSYFLSLIRFPITRNALLALHPPLRIPTAAPPRNPEMRPCFPRTDQRKGAYNQE
jgi:hypothetical protein